MHLYEKKDPAHKTVVQIGDGEIGRGFVVFAGPCAIEDATSFSALTEAITPYVQGFRAGLFKPRTSPYSFSGLGPKGLALLEQLKLPVIVELLDPDQVRRYGAAVDIIQVGARNMYNYPLLQAAADSGKPVLLKRHFSATLDELLLAAEHILARGNSQVILCERGIRTFEPRLRNCLDLGAVAVLKQITHLPVLADPSHAAGDASLVAPLALAAAAAGADGLLLEVHPRPLAALSDGAQSITPHQLAALSGQLKKLLALREN